LLIAFGKVNGVKLFPLDIFDNRDFQHFLVAGNFFDIGGNYFYPQLNRGAQPSLSGNNLVAAIVVRAD